MELAFEVLVSGLCRKSPDPIKLGNAEFWLEDGELIHAPAMAAWDREAIARDILAALLGRPVEQVEHVRHIYIGGETREYRVRRIGEADESISFGADVWRHGIDAAWSAFASV